MDLAGRDVRQEFGRSGRVFIEIVPPWLNRTASVTILAKGGPAANVPFRPTIGRLTNSRAGAHAAHSLIRFAPSSRRADAPSDPMTDSTISAGSIAFLGFGEAAHAFLDGWRTDADFKARISAYDIKTDSPDPRCGRRSEPTMWRRTSSARRPRPRRSPAPRRCSRSSPPIRRMRRRSPPCRA